MKFIFNSRRFKAAHTTNGGSLRKVDFGKSTKSFFKDVVEFCSELTTYIIKKLHLSFIKFEGFKKIFVVVLYRQRGKYAKRFIHSGMAGLAALGILIATVVADEFPKNQ